MAKRRTERVEIDEDFYVLQSLTLGEANDIMKECSTFDPVSGTLNLDTQKLGEMRLAKMIKEWSEKDGEGKIKPINRDSIRDLPEEVGGHLLLKMRGTGAIPSELEKK